MHRTLAHYLAVPALAVAAVLGGCRSDDQHEFVMSLDRQGTMTIVDTLTEEPLWTKDVAPGQRLVLNFERDGAWHDDEVFLTKAIPADVVHWSLYHHRKGLVLDHRPWGDSLGRGTVELPGTPVRMEMTYQRVDASANRAAPIYAPESDARATPADEAPAAEEAAATEETPVAEETPAPQVTPEDAADSTPEPQGETAVPAADDAAETPAATDDAEPAEQTPAAEPADDVMFK